jgi:hypothetical protein
VQFALREVLQALVAHGREEDLAGQALPRAAVEEDLLARGGKPGVQKLLPQRLGGQLLEGAAVRGTPGVQADFRQRAFEELAVMRLCACV